MRTKCGGKGRGGIYSASVWFPWLMAPLYDMPWCDGSMFRGHAGGLSSSSAKGWVAAGMSTCIIGAGVCVCEGGMSKWQHCALEGCRVGALLARVASLVRVRERLEASSMLAGTSNRGRAAGELCGAVRASEGEDAMREAALHPLATG